MTMQLKSGVFLIVGLTAGMACGQGAAPAPGIVQLNVIALDAHGAPVTDLKGDDFQVSDAGKTQRVVFFHHEVPRTRAVPLGAQEYSNRADVSFAPATAVLFDLLNSNMGERGVSTPEIVRALRRVEVADHVYLYLLTKAGVLAPIRGVPPESDLGIPGGDWIEQISPVLDGALVKYNQLRTQDLRVPGEFVSATFNALGQLGGQLAIFPGPKNIIWITRGVPILVPDATTQPYDFTPQLRQLSGDFRRANIAVNSVKTSIGEQSLERSTLEMFADLTAGRAYLGDEVETAIVQVIQNARSSYRIAYFPPAQSWDKKFHKIKVTCTRKGVRLQSAQGYIADRAREQPAQEEAAKLAWAESLPFEISDIGLRAKTVPAASGAGRVVQLRVDAADVAMLPEQDHNRGQLAWTAVRFYRDDRQPTMDNGNMDLDLTTPQLAAALAEGISLSVPMDPTVERLRIVVLDRSAHTVGTLTIFPRGE